MAKKRVALVLLILVAVVGIGLGGVFVGMNFAGSGTGNPSFLEEVPPENDRVTESFATEVAQPMPTPSQGSAGYELAPGYSVPPQSPLGEAAQARYAHQIRIASTLTRVPGYYYSETDYHKFFYRALAPQDRPALVKTVNSAKTITNNLKRAGYVQHIQHTHFWFVVTAASERNGRTEATMDLYVKSAQAGNHMYKHVETITLHTITVVAGQPAKPNVIPIFLKCHNVPC